MNYHGLVLVLILFSTSIFARPFKSIAIPGATCGNGMPYKVFYHDNGSDKLTIEFMGGGACWSAESCFGKELSAWVAPIPNVPILSVFMIRNSVLSPAHDNSYLYFPYCTGDTHAGNHQAVYIKDDKTYRVNHFGKVNIEKAFEYLIDQEVISPDYLKSLIVYGASAGAIGAIVHQKTLDEKFSKVDNKTMILDAPGLHWGKKFWKKFPELYQKDFKNVFSDIGLPQELDHGLLAKYTPSLCGELSSWKVGFLQGTEDIIMSLGFGSISKGNHKKNVLGPEGFYEQSKTIANCASWIPDTSQHTFMAIPFTQFVKAGGIKAQEFIFKVYNGDLSSNYK